MMTFNTVMKILIMNSNEFSVTGCMQSSAAACWSAAQSIGNYAAQLLQAPCALMNALLSF
jgi:hypothetical protein